jgi:hypothetical protein
MKGRQGSEDFEGIKVARVSDFVDLVGEFSDLGVQFAFN